MKIIKYSKKDMKDAYREFTQETWNNKAALTTVWQSAWDMAVDSLNSKQHFGYYEPMYPVDNSIYTDYDPHIGCYSYPNCDIDPNGCCVEHGMDAEPYGHRD